MDMDNNLWSSIAVVLYLFAFYFLIKSVSRGLIGGAIAITFSIVSLLFSLLTGSYLIANWFTGIGFDDSVFYQFRFGTEGIGLWEFLPLILLFVSVQIFFFLLIVFYIRIFFINKSKSFLILPFFMGVGMIFCAFFVAPATSNLISYLFTTQIMEDFPEYFVKPQISKIQNVNKPKNVLYFYLESLERNYMDENLFPGLLPELHKIGQDSVTFTHIGQTIGGSWTMAGMVASQCGLPLLSVFTNDNFHMNNFMPDAVCLGDILKSQGYHLEFMGGANNEFAGKGLFYKNHGFINVEGQKEFIDKDIGDGYLNSWGLFDDTLYEQLFNRIKTLHKKKSPWGVFSINIGTHQPEGYLARQCEKVKYGDGNDNLLNAAHCTDALIGQLYRALKAEGILDDTVVVFASDHLAPVTVKPYETLEKAERHNLFMVSGAGIHPAKKTRPGTTLDIAPTLLNYLQFGSQAIGLGRDLNGKLPTLAETFPLQKLIDAKLISWRKVIDMSFWGYPDLKNNLAISLNDKKIVIDNQKFPFPALIRYTPSGKIEEILYGSENVLSSGDNRFLLEFFLSSLIVNNQLFLWIDRCDALATLNPGLGGYKGSYCYYNGSLASTRSVSSLISNDNSSIKLEMDNAFTISSSQASYFRKELIDKNLIHWGKVIFTPETQISHTENTVSAAGINAIVKSTSVAGTEISDPGLFLVRNSYNYSPASGINYKTEVMSKISLCDKSSDSFSIAQLSNTLPLEKGYVPLFYAIVGNLDQECKQGVTHPLTDSSLNDLSNLKPGEPYIALFDEKMNTVHEKTGHSNQTIAIYLKFNDNE